MSLKYRAIMFGVIVAITGCGPASGYRADAVSGRVVHADTGQPLPDVIVVIAWPLFTGPHGQDAGYLKLDEAITDRNGSYHFSSWKGIPTPPYSDLVRDAPHLAFFKRGYSVHLLYNDQRHPAGSPRSDSLSSDWNGRTIKLAPFEGAIEDYARNADALSDYYAGEEGLCRWKDLPLLTEELVNLRQMFGEKGVRTFTGLPSRDLIRLNQDKCRNTGDVQ